MVANAGQLLRRDAAPVPVAGSGRDAEVVINSVSGPSSYRFSIDVPAGGHLRAADSGPVGQETIGDIVVEDASGQPIGAYDGAWALDTSGTPVKSTFRIEGNTLVQSVNLKRSTAFPVILGLIYSDISTGSTAAGPDAISGTSGEMTTMGSGPFVGIPSNYVYNPSLGSLHDYCTNSPDEFPAPFASNANFRGPCARHDLCYAGTTSEFTCDNGLRSDMRTNCAYEYSSANPLRSACYTTADVYWAAVVIAT